MEQKQFTHVRRVFQQEQLYKKPADEKQDNPYGTKQTGKTKQPASQLTPAVTGPSSQTADLPYGEDDFHANFIMETTLPSITTHLARRGSTEEISDLLQLTKITGHKRNNLPIYKSQSFITAQPLRSSKASLQPIKQESLISGINLNGQPRNRSTTIQPSELIRYENSGEYDFSNQSSSIVDTYQTSQSNRKRVEQLISMLQGGKLDNDNESSGIRQNRNRSELPKSLNIDLRPKSKQKNGPSADSINVSDLMMQVRPTKKQRISLETIQSIGMGRRQGDYLASMNKKPIKSNKLATIYSQFQDEQQEFLDSWLRESHSNRFSEVNSVLTYKPRSKVTEKARLSGLSYVMQAGQVKPTISYIKSSPFIKDQKQLLRNGSQTVQKGSSGLAPMISKQLSQESIETLSNPVNPVLPPISAVSRNVSQSYRITLEQIDDDESHDDAVVTVDGLIEAHNSLLEQLESQVKLFEQYVKVAQLAGAIDAGAAVVQSLQRQFTAQSSIKSGTSVRGSIQQTASARRVTTAPDLDDLLDRQSQLKYHKDVNSMTRLDSVQSLRPLDIIVEYHGDTSSKGAISMLKKLPASTNPVSLWLKRVKKLYAQLEEHKNIEISELMNQHSERKFLLDQMIHDNTFEHQILRAKQKCLVTATSKQIKKLESETGKIIPAQQEEGRIELKIKKEIVRRNELSQWGFNSYVISYTIQVRMMEDLIDRVQRLQKPGANDYKTVQEVSRLAKQRQQTFEDLDTFVTNREKKHWRNWDKYKDSWRKFSWFRIVPPRQVIYDYCRTQNTELDKRAKIMTTLNGDFDALQKLSDQMVEWLSNTKGGHGWLRLFNLSKLRLQQSQKVNQFDPNVKMTALKLIVEAQSPKSKIPQIQSPTSPGELLTPGFKAQTNLTVALSPKLQTLKDQTAKEEETPPRLTFAPLIFDKNDKSKASASPSPATRDTGTSKWLLALSKEKDEKEKKSALQDPNRAARMARLAHLFEDSSDSEADDKAEDRLDQLAAKENLNKFLQKVDHHLDIEKVLIDEWSTQPQQLQLQKQAQEPALAKKVSLKKNR